MGVYVKMMMDVTNDIKVCDNLRNIFVKKHFEFKDKVFSKDINRAVLRFYLDITEIVQNTKITYYIDCDCPVFVLDGGKSLELISVEFSNITRVLPSDLDCGIRLNEITDCHIYNSDTDNWFSLVREIDTLKKNIELSQDYIGKTRSIVNRTIDSAEGTHLTRNNALDFKASVNMTFLQITSFMSDLLKEKMDIYKKLILDSINNGKCCSMIDKLQTLDYKFI